MIDGARGWFRRLMARDPFHVTFAAGRRAQDPTYDTSDLPVAGVLSIVGEDGELHELAELVAGTTIRVETAVRDPRNAAWRSPWLSDPDAGIRDQDGGIRDQDGVEPIGDRNQCWRCWAKAVDEGDELGLCDRCKADLKDPETGPDEATNLHAIAERYSALNLLEIALERRAAGELIPEAVIDGLLARAEFEAFLEGLRDGLLARADEDGN